MLGRLVPLPPQGPRTIVPATTSEFWVDAASEAAKLVEQWHTDGRVADAAQLEKIARQPEAHSVGGEGNTTDKTRGFGAAKVPTNVGNAARP